MISYVTIGVNDIPRARKFYDAVLGALGHRRVYETDDWLGYTDAIGSYMPRIWVCIPIDGNAATVGNGSMIGLHAKSPADVDRFHAVGLAHGGTNEGDPGRRAHYQKGYYLGYLRDPDGNKLSAFCNTDLIKPDGTYDPQPVFPTGGQGGS
jgi:catechol 2,3-dioxygenase-like lactoylglutathione lyase family enzyme